MDDLSEKLAGILNDPDSIEQVKKMAENLFSGEKTLFEENGGVDDRTRLLNALKPYLSEKKQAKADNAIKLLKIIELWPLIKDSGMFNL